jgi:hypothetical protein
MVVRRTGSEASEARAAREAQQQKWAGATSHDSDRPGMDVFADSIFESTVERGYKGTMYEVDALGSMKKTPAYEQAYRKLTGKDYKDLSAHSGDIPGMMRVIREHYNLDPLKPVKPIARELRLAIVRYLKLTPVEANRFKFYTAVQSGALDSKHHIDGWFEYEIPGAEPRWVGVDASMRPEGEKKEFTTSMEVNRVPVDPETDDQRKAFIYLIEQKFAPRLAKQFQTVVDQERAKAVRRAA